jgi:hypothetical protein
MDIDSRILAIQKVITEKKDAGSKKITYKGENTLRLAYDIDVEALIFNQYNGRIGTFVQTHEKLHGEKIDATTVEGEDLIVNFLWKSDEKANLITKADIEDIGQQEVGIITKDGVVIDGNRRCMLLKTIAKEKHSTPTYFRAVVLDDKLSDNPKEIRKLETSYQLGIDKPQSYKPIEKYLKCKELFYTDDFTLEEIALMMGEKDKKNNPDPKKIQTYLNILALMERFLKTYGYDGIYTYLSENEQEGPFVDLEGYLARYKSKNGNIKGRDWTPDTADINDLELIYFDYIRAGYGTHKIRCIGNTASKTSFFNTKAVWDDFFQRYEENVEPINNQEKSFTELRSERPDEDPEALIKARDSDWKASESPNGKKLSDNLSQNLGLSQTALSEAIEDEGPLFYLTRAILALGRIDMENSAFEGQFVEAKIKDINDFTWKFKKALKEKLKNNE